MRSSGRLAALTTAAVVGAVLSGGVAGASMGHGPFSPTMGHGPFSPTPPGAFGTVSAVGGVSTTGTCGTAGDTSGTFSLSAYKSSTTWTVDLTPTTTFVDPGISSASFANVCVGELVGALGTVSVSTDTVTASKVFVAPVVTPPTPRGAFGTVTAVGGVSTTGTCGSGSSGTFTLSTWKNTSSWTVTVSSSTTYLEPGVSSPSFTDVCVGSPVGVLGAADVSSSTITAAKVFITPPPPGVFGKVASVGGVSTPGTCGTAGDTSGTFTLTAFEGSTTWTVDLTSTTTFAEPGASSPSFANVCVSELVGALGAVDEGTDTVTASKVLVAPVVTPPPTLRGVFGTVSAVGGVSTTGTCGSGTSGTFTLSTWKNTSSWTVTVTSSTTYQEPGASSPSFANVCVGSLVGVLGAVDSSDNTVTASHVVLTQPTPWVPGGLGFSARGRR